MIITHTVTLVPFPLPYVTDGLIGCWDGEWNAAPGVHDPSLQKWCDISGFGHDLEKTYSNCDYPEYTARWGENYYSADYGFKTNLQATGLDAIYDALENRATVEFISNFSRSEPDGGQCVNFYITTPSRAFLIDPANNTAAQGPVITWRFHDWERSRQTQYADTYMPQNKISEALGTHTYIAIIEKSSCRVLVDNILKKTLVGNREYARSWNGLCLRTQKETIARYYCLRVYNRVLTPAELEHNRIVDRRRFYTTSEETTKALQ